MNLWTQDTNSLYLAGTLYDKEDNEKEFSYAHISPQRYETTTNGLTEFVRALASIKVAYGLPVVKGDRVKLENGLFYTVVSTDIDKSVRESQHKSLFLKDSQKYQVLNLG